MSQRAVFWTALAVILLTFLVIDAGALAWSASLAGGLPITAGILTFLAVVCGLVLTARILVGSCSHPNLKSK